MRWNPAPEDVQKSVAQLVLAIVELLRRLMERQAIRRMDRNSLSPEEVERVGKALMTLEQTVREIGKKFGLTPEELNLDLGPLGRLMSRPAGQAARYRARRSLQPAAVQLQPRRSSSSPRRSSNAWEIVPASTYSSSPPRGTPRAMRLTLMPRGRSISAM